jgi:hypothetical protein
LSLGDLLTCRALSAFWDLHDRLHGLGLS